MFDQRAAGNSFDPHGRAVDADLHRAGSQTDLIAQCRGDYQTSYLIDGRFHTTKCTMRPVAKPGPASRRRPLRPELGQNRIEVPDEVVKRIRSRELRSRTYPGGDVRPERSGTKLGGAGFVTCARRDCDRHQIRADFQF